MTPEAVLSWFRGKRVLITGGAGMLGSTIALKLVEAGARVKVLDAMLATYGGNLFNLEPVRDQIQFLQADLRSPEAVLSAVEGAEVVFNLAAQVSYIDSNRDLITDLDINCKAQINLLEAAQKAGARPKIVFASSRFVYGKIEYNPVDEKHPFNCLSIYGIHKLVAEKYHKFFTLQHGIPTVSLRIANPYGPRQQMKHSKYGIVNWFIRSALEGKPLTVYGEGLQARDYVYVEDVAWAFLYAAWSDRTGGECYNVGSGTGTPFQEMAHRVAELVPGTRVIHTEWNLENQLVETGNYVTDISKIRRDTGWGPHVSIGEGVARTLDFYRRNRELYWKSDSPLAEVQP
ncbi:MAG: SDR family NAD(P)-dependent oxidoreductase [Candidatus Omnitrophica bacterium]|nr:SDR family NAD(P)-dependent oxidoreductase [Candidatus Omnitrophota bacterium]